MGRDSKHLCHDCKVFQENGYGSYGTWIDCHTTLASYDEAAVKHSDHVELGKNQNVREFLVAHHGHRVDHYSSDFDCGYDENCEGPVKDPEYLGYTLVPHKHHFGCDCKLRGEG
jgi:hypothetical protein